MSGSLLPSPAETWIKCLIYYQNWVWSLRWKGVALGLYWFGKYKSDNIHWTNFSLLFKIWSLLFFFFCHTIMIYYFGLINCSLITCCRDFSVLFHVPQNFRLNPFRILRGNGVHVVHCPLHFFCILLLENSIASLSWVSPVCQQQWFFH